MGNSLTEVKTVFTIDLAPYLAGLKTALTMTQQTGVQMKPLLNLQIDKASFTDLEKTFNSYLNEVKGSLPVVKDASGASDGLSHSRRSEGEETEKAKRSNDEHSTSLKRSKRDALESYGAVMFLTQGILRMAQSTSGGSKTLDTMNRAMSEGVGQGFELAGLLSMMKIASGGTAVAIGAIATIAVTLTRVFSDLNDTTALNEKIQNDFVKTLNGMTIPQLEEYRKSISKAIAENTELLKTEKEKAKLQEISAVGTTNRLFLLRSLFGITNSTKQLEETLNKTKKEGEALDQKISGQQKTSGEIALFAAQAKIDSILRTNLRDRAEAKKTFDEEQVMINTSMAVGKQKDDALIASRSKYHTKLREISNSEVLEAVTNAKLVLDAYIKAANDRAEMELNVQKASLINQGLDAESIDLRMIQSRRANLLAQYKQFPSGPLSPEQLAKQTELENQLTQLGVQEAEKRKAIKQNEKDTSDKISELQLQSVINRVRISGLVKVKTEEEISQEVLNEKKKTTDAELKVLIDKESSGKQLDQKEKIRRQELQTALSDIDLQGEELRKTIAEKARQQVLDGLKELTNQMGNLFGSLFQLEQQRTVKTVGEEKKRKQASLDSEKERRIAAAQTADERSAIEQEYADKKTALDAEMDAKAKEQMRDMFTLQKAAQIANAMIATYSAAAAALAPPPLGLGPVFGPIVAATAIAAGLANIAVISSQEVPGLALGAKVTQPGLFQVGEAGTEWVMPEKNFLQAFRDDLAPRLLEIMAPKIKGSLLAGAGQYGGGINLQINIDQYYGTEEHFERVVKPAVEDAMRRAGTNDSSSLFRNQSTL